MKKLKIFLKYIGYALACILTILLLYIAVLKIYDSIRLHRIKSAVVQIKVGDTKESVIEKLGEPTDSWNRGDKGLPGPWGASYRPDSGLIYGSIFRYQPFGFADDDFVIRLNESNIVYRIRMPEE